jgi:3-oxoacyl-[acyl-carrier-protein] synthase-1
MNLATDTLLGREPVTGHTAPVVANGFLGVAKALRLGRYALADLISQTGLKQKDFARTGIHINLADQFLTDAHDAAVRAEESRGEATDPRDAEEDVLPLPSARWQQQCTDFIPRLFRQCDLEPAAESRIYFGGHAGFIETVQNAVKGIQQGTFDRCVIGGVDCCVEPAFLVAAMAKGLLKTAENPCGFLPGEAASFVLLETLSGARSRGAQTIAMLRGTATGKEDFDCLSDRPPHGAAMARTVGEALSRAFPKNPRARLIIADLNGDTYRAMDWGYALVRVRREFGLGQLPVWLPAQAFGETGAATGPLAVCLAAQALGRGYAPSGGVLICLSSDNGARAAICLDTVSA